MYLYRLIGALLLAATASPAFADQCELLTPEEAQSALKLVQLANEAKETVLVHLCEPCGDTVEDLETLSGPVQATLKKVTTEQNGDSFFSLFINGVAIDLSYHYVKTGPNTWTNLSKAIGCPSSGVSSFLWRSEGGSSAIYTLETDR